MFRLGGPTLLYAFVIHPLLVYGSMKAEGRQNGALTGFQLDYLRRFGFLSGTGPLRFAAALLIFAAAYAGISLNGGCGRRSPIATVIPTRFRLGGISGARERSVSRDPSAASR